MNGPSWNFFCLLSTVVDPVLFTLLVRVRENEILRCSVVCLLHLRGKCIG